MSPPRLTADYTWQVDTKLIPFLEDYQISYVRDPEYLLASPI